MDWAACPIHFAWENISGLIISLCKLDSYE